MCDFEFTGKITSILQELGHGNCIFSVSSTSPDTPRNFKNEISCRYLKERCKIGLTVRICGNLYDDNSIAVTSFIPEFINESSCLDLLQTIHGIGLKKAKRIYQLFGEDIFSTPRESMKATLCQAFPDMRLLLVENILDTLCIYNPTLMELETFLIPYNVTYDVIYAIYTEYKERALSFVKKDPYGIFCKYRVSFYICEKIAHDLGIKAFSATRLSGIIHYLLMYNTNSGHTLMLFADLFKQADYLSNKSCYNTKIPKILLLDRIYWDKSLYYDKTSISFLSLYKKEEMVAKEALLLSKEYRKDVITEEDIAYVEKLLQIHYSPSQKKAFSLIASPRISFLIGGPGTGKTTIIKGLIVWYVNKYPEDSIALCAPTGRAAKRLSESTGYPASTIHKLIDYRPFLGGDSTHKDRSNPIMANLIIVDEASMIDVSLMLLLLQAIRPGTTVIFVGDENQLPSVGAGSVLRDMVASKIFPVCRLDENHRQNHKGSLIANGKRILRGIMPIAAEDFAMYSVHSSAEGLELMNRFFQELYKEEDPFYMQIIEPSYKGNAGIHVVNKTIRSYLKRDMDKKISVKDKIIFTKNVYDKHYVNGQLGFVVSIEGRKMVISSDEQMLILSAADLPFIEPAYSFSVHKAQGSEASVVLIYLPKAPMSLLQRSMLYTAVTRAKEKVVLIYEDDALQIALKNNKANLRKTRLQGLLKKLQTAYLLS
ncbi:exodeoxyribonuclease V alpha subunit [Lachnospiraceae bacterium KHCPX20]|nr:exodeoxyribonuclease V alpha subunit [Lachnospiraceae bacterium KHCPX20]